MKRAFAILAFSAVALPCLAQSSRVQQQGSPTQPVKIEMVCRDMATTGNYLAPNETMIADRACHPVDVQRLGTVGEPANSPVVSADRASAAAPATPAPADPTAGHRDIFATSMMPPSAPVDNSIRVYVTNSLAWDARGGWPGKSGEVGPATPATPAAASDKEATEQAAAVDKLIREINQGCPNVLITSSIDRAGFAVTLDNQKKGRFSEENRIAVYNHSGDDIFSDATKNMADSVDGACKAILKSAGR